MYMFMLVCPYITVGQPTRDKPQLPTGLVCAQWVVRRRSQLLKSLHHAASHGTAAYHPPEHSHPSTSGSWVPPATMAVHYDVTSQNRHEALNDPFHPTGWAPRCPTAPPLGRYGDVRVGSVGTRQRSFLLP